MQSESAEWVHRKIGKATSNETSLSRRLHLAGTPAIDIALCWVSQNDLASVVGHIGRGPSSTSLHCRIQLPRQLGAVTPLVPTRALCIVPGHPDKTMRGW